MDSRVSPVIASAALLVSSACRGATQSEIYPLDKIPRVISARGRVRCPRVKLVIYRGDTVRYHKPVRVYVGFRERLRRFERVVRKTAITVYGRAPRRIRHLGSYNCRRISAWPTYLSEHGLGNAIDILGFDFGWARGKQARGLARWLRRPFRVRVLRHWNARGRARIHKRFLRSLAAALVKRRDIFRVLLGPGYPGHKNHFHFDHAPYRLVEMSGIAQASVTQRLLRKIARAVARHSQS